MNCFDDKNVNLDALKKKAYNLRWAEVDDGVIPLTAADPDFPCPPMVKQAILDYVSDGYYHESEAASAPSFDIKIDGIE